MKRDPLAGAVGTLLAFALLSPAHAGAADGSPAPRPRHQPVAEAAACAGVERARERGADAALVVRVALELGHEPCQVIRCALAGRCPDQGSPDLEQVIRGAAAAGVPADVIARCSVAVCDDRAAVAALLAEALLEPYYCYFSRRQGGAPAPLPPPQPVIDRSQPSPQFSPFRF